MKKKLSLFLAFVLVLSLFVPVTTAFADTDTFISAYEAIDPNNLTWSAVYTAKKEYEALDSSEKYSLDTDMIDTLYEKYIPALYASWDGADDFSDTAKSSFLWTDGLTNYIKDGKFYIPKRINWGPADYALVDGIIAENDKPVAVNFDINLLNTDYGPRFNLFTGKTSGPIVDFQCAGGKFIFDVDANGWSKKSSTGGTSIFTGVQNVNIDYNWDNWAAANEVTVTVTLSQNGATKTLTGVFLFTESETNIKPTVFNLGFIGTNNGKAVYIDNFTLVTEKNADSKATAYANFKEDHKVALGYNFDADTIDVDLCKAMVDGYNALDSYTRFLFTVDEVTQITNAANYVTARDYVTTYSTLFDVTVTAENADQMLAAVHTYDDLDDAVKTFITADETAKIEAMRTNAVEYYVTNFKNDHATVLGLTVETEDTVLLENKANIITAINKYYELDELVQAGLTDEIALLESLESHIVKNIEHAGWDGWDSTEKRLTAVTKVEDLEFQLGYKFDASKHCYVNDSNNSRITTYGQVLKVKPNSVLNFTPNTEIGIKECWIVEYSDSKPLSSDSYKKEPGAWITTTKDYRLSSETNYIVIILKAGTFVEGTDLSAVNSCFKYYEEAVMYGGNVVEVVDDFTELKWTKEYTVSESNHKFQTGTSRATHVGQVLMVTGGSTIKYTASSNSNGYIVVQYRDSLTLNGSSKIKHYYWISGDYTLDAEAKYVVIAVRGKSNFTDETAAELSSCFSIYNEGTVFEENHSAAWKYDIRATEFTEEQINAVTAAITAYEAITDTEIQAEYELEYRYLKLLAAEMSESDFDDYDVNGDTVVDIRDLVCMKKFAANSIGQYDAASLTGMRQTLLGITVTE